MNNTEFRSVGDVHTVVLEGRQKAGISGVREVVSFDENEVVMDTNRGMLTISGENLHVEKLSLDIGELSLEGEIDAVVYADDQRQKGGFWSRIF